MTKATEFVAVAVCFVLGVVLVAVARRLSAVKRDRVTSDERVSDESFLQLGDDELRSQIKDLLDQANVEAQLQWVSFGATTAICVGLTAALVESLSVDSADWASKLLAIALSGLGTLVSITGKGATDRISRYHQLRWRLAQAAEKKLFKANTGMIALGAALSRGRVVVVDGVEVKNDSLARWSGHTLISLSGVAWIAFFSAATLLAIVRAAV